MLESLRFVQGAVAKKDMVPVLSHFQIRDGYVMGYNGRIALKSPIACDLEATPAAVPFINAINTCTGEVSLSLTSNNRLAVRSGKFKAFIKCTEEPYPLIEPTGEFLECGNILEAFRVLLPLVSEDASRPWSRGILLRGSSAYATNNVVLAQYWLGYETPCPLNIPKTTIQELLRIGEEPLGLQVSKDSITFYFKEQRYLHSMLYSLDWPDVEAVLARPAQEGAQLTDIPDGFFDAIQELTPFADKLGRLYVTATGITTAPPESENEGARIELPLAGTDVVLAAKQVGALIGLATKIDLRHTSPGNMRPCPWAGDNIRGVIIGMRK